MDQAVQHFDAPVTVAQGNPDPVLESDVMLDSIAFCTSLSDLYCNTRLHLDTAA